MTETFVATMKRWILLIGVAFMLAAEGVSLLFIGMNGKFFVSLLIGGAVSAAGVVLLAVMAGGATGKGLKVFTIFSYMIRLVLYAGALILCYYLFGKAGCYGAAAGLMSMFVGLVVTGMFAQRARKNAAPVYEEDPINEEKVKNRKFAVIKKQYFEKKTKQRHYVTYRRYKKYRKINRIENKRG